MVDGSLGRSICLGRPFLQSKIPASQWQCHSIVVVSSSLVCRGLTHASEISDSKHLDLVGNLVLMW